MVTIIRSIPSLYQSTFEYMTSQVAAFKNAANFTEFAAAPQKYYKSAQNGNGREHFAKNHMAFDLGFDNKIDDMEIINEYISYMEYNYELVLIR